MNVVALNSVKQNSNLYNTKKSPAFEAKLNIEEGAQKVINKGLTDFYNGCIPKVKKEIFGDKPLDLKQLTNDIQQAFEEMTKAKDPDGIVTLIPDISSKKFPGTFLNLTYQYPHGKIIKSWSPLMPYELLPYPLFDKGTPLKSAVEHISAKVSDAMAKDGKGYGENNPFSSVFHELINK